MQIYAYTTYAKHGYLSQDASTGRLVLDESRTLAVLDAFSEQFEAVLECEDRADGAALAAILAEMEQESDFVRAVVRNVNAT